MLCKRSSLSACLIIISFLQLPYLAVRMVGLNIALAWAWAVEALSSEGLHIKVRNMVQATEAYICSWPLMALVLIVGSATTVEHLMQV